MVNNIDILGYVAMGLSVLSFVLPKQRLIRTTNIIACLVWVWYGLMINNYPTIIVNMLVVFVHAYWFIKRYYHAKKWRMR